MTTYLGTLNNLIELKSPSTLTVAGADNFTFETTLEGKPKAQVRPLSRRQWQLRMETATPAELAAVAAFAAGEWGFGPFVWVPTDAPVTNLLTPAQATCDPSVIIGSSNITAGGPLSLGRDGMAGRSYFNPTPATALYFGADKVPVIPGQDVTASAYLLGDGADMRLRWFDANNTFISTTAGPATGSSSEVRRVSVTATPPTGAKSIQINTVNAVQAARPAVTWTSQPFDWFDGQGCTKAVISGMSRQLLLALREPLYGRYSDASFLITEVG